MQHKRSWRSLHSKRQTFWNPVLPGQALPRRWVTLIKNCHRYTSSGQSARCCCGCCVKCFRRNYRNVAKATPRRTAHVRRSRLPPVFLGVCRLPAAVQSFTAFPAQGPLKGSAYYLFLLFFFIEGVSLLIYQKRTTRTLTRWYSLRFGFALMSSHIFEVGICGRAEGERDAERERCRE